ncbi:Venom carboxylesterase-6 [Gryllus bimaculatus]|nr:Venom carboxylesterase-6 [Gryllus bimaculatus]
MPKNDKTHFTANQMSRNMGVQFSWCLFIFLAYGSAAEPPPMVQTVYGPVRGSYMKSASGKQFAAFRGIPYARPPVGKYRFEKSAPYEKWPDTWNATEYGSPCLQYDFTFSPEQERVIGDEDCLFVNVFTPKLPSSKNNDFLDVFVYIHGGAFVHGAGSLYGPKYLMDHNFVAVTFNYRLGVLGFLSTEDEVVPGNNGLKDQSLALQWIKKNIHAFGGNPEKITITGTSAGGASVHYHYLSPFSRGLFKQGMSFSGSALTPWAQGYQHKEKTKKVADLVGCSTETSREMVECLKTRPARKIVEQTKHFQVWRFIPFNPFGPIIPEPGKTPFLSKQPVDIILGGEAQDLPWLTSITTEEGLYPAAVKLFLLQTPWKDTENNDHTELEFAAKDEALQDLNEKFNDIAPHLLFFNYTVNNQEKNQVSDKIRQYYFQDKPILQESRQELIQMVGDRTFVVAVERAARLMASANSQPVYFYVFSHRGYDSISNFMSKTNINMGVSHGDDTGYIMHMTFCNTELSEEDRAVSQLMLDICKNFAKTGNPTPTRKNIVWKPVGARSEELDYLSIPNSKEITMKSSLDLGHTRFWDSLPLNEPHRFNHVKHSEL